MSATATPTDPRARLLDEDLIGLAQLAASIKSHRRHGSLAIQACWRWATKGVKLPNGTVVKLETVRLAGRYLTSREAYKRFLLAQTPDSGQPAPAPVRSPGKRERGSKRAERVLSAAGI